jgi:hypothetical protein
LEISPLYTALRPVFSQLTLLRILLTFRMKPTARKLLISFSCVGHQKISVRIYDASWRNQYSNSNVAYTKEKWWRKILH